MADRYVLALDVGTQSARAIVFDAGGALVARAQVAFTPYHSAAPGWAEQDVEAVSYTHLTLPTTPYV